MQGRGGPSTAYRRWDRSGPGTGSAARSRTRSGSLPVATSAIVTSSRICRSLARSAIHTSCSAARGAVVAERPPAAARARWRAARRSTRMTLGEGDLRGRPGQPVAALRAALGVHDRRRGAAGAGCSPGTSAGSPAPAAMRSAVTAGACPRARPPRARPRRAARSRPGRTGACRIRLAPCGCHAPTRRSRPSWTAVAMCRPSRVNMRPVASPRAPEADGLQQS